MNMRIGKFILVFMIATRLFCGFASADPTFSEGYRNSKWGMSSEEVKSKFKDYKFQKDDEGDIFIKDKIIGIDVQIFFKFFEGKLKEVQILHEVKDLFGTPQDIKRGLSNFDALYVALKKKYGEPKKMSKNIPEFYTAETAIDLGATSFFSQWNTKESKIRLFLGKGKGLFSSVTLAIVYSATYYEEIEKRESAKSKL